MGPQSWPGPPPNWGIWGAAATSLLSVEEKNALYLGLKHHILPKDIDILKLKSTIENYTSKVFKMHKVLPDEEFKDELKFATSAFLRASTTRCRSRYNKALHNCLSKLSRNQTIKICQFDKGNGVAILNSECYFKKLDSIVNDSTKFKEINFSLGNNSLEECKSAPWIKKANSVKYYLTTYIKPIVDPLIYLNLLPSGSVPGRLYGKAKIHKTGCPLRPVTSMINTPEYNLAKWLDSLIKPYIPDRYSLSSTSSFIDRIKELKPNNDAKLVSFDVTSLFTNVPVDLVIDDIANKLFSYDVASKLPFLQAKKPITQNIFKKLLKLSTEGMFIHNGKLFSQIDGVAMGNPLGPTLANWFLGMIEKKIFDQHLSFYPSFYVRYVDDVFAIFNSAIEVQMFLEVLNNQHPNLRFTCEQASRPSLPFLDVQLTIWDREFNICVYRKPTFTGVLLHFNSIAPLSWKRGLINCLLHRAYLYSSNDSLLKTEITRIISLFKRNGYPTSFILNVIDKFKIKFKNQNQQSPTDFSNNTPNLSPYLTLPYIGTPSIKFSKRLAALFRDRLSTDIKVAYQTFKIISYFNLKFPLPALFCSNVVYKYTCSWDKNTSYIGMTTRQLFVRIENHLSTNLSSSNSAIKSHRDQCKACRETIPAEQNFTLLKKCRFSTETELMEAFLIKRLKPSLNIKLGYSQGAKSLLQVFH